MFLILVKTLEVIRLHTVRSQHRLLSGGVFSHEIMGQSEVNFVGSSFLSSFEISLVVVTFLTSHLVISLLICDSDVETLLGMVLLSLFQ